MTIGPNGLMPSGIRVFIYFSLKTDSFYVGPFINSSKIVSLDKRSYM